MKFKLTSKKLIETNPISRGPHAKVEALVATLNSDVEDGWTYEARKVSATESMAFCIDEEGVEVGAL